MKSVHFLSNQTFFLGKIRRPTESEILQYSEESINKSLSPDKLRLFSPSKKKFQDFFPYSCFANKTNTKIFLNNRCLSGNLLNRSLMKEDINNKIIFPEGDSYEFDQVLDENLRY